MVFPIVLKHIKRKSDSRASFLLCVIVSTATSLSACGAQDDASAQSNRTALEQSTKNTTNTANTKNTKVESGSVSAGQIVFERANCAMCHPGGNNTMDPGHPIKGPEFARKYSDDLVLETTIRKGFPDVGMPAFSKKTIDDHEMKDLIAYVRTLTKK